MKTASLSSLLAPVILALALPATAQVVQEKTVKTTTTSGVLNEFGPERIIIRTEAAPKPLTYSVTKTTTYVDDAGAPVAMEAVQTGLPITVHYTRSGDTLVASRVVVHKRTTTAVPAVPAPPAVAETTTTTTTRGTITEFAPSERVVIRTTTSAAPVRYRFTKTTTYVNAAGQPVSIKTIKSGLPATIHYVKEGNELIATRVVVDTGVAPVPGTTRTVTETTETTNTEASGTIRDFKNDQMTIVTAVDPAPAVYSFSGATKYMDEEGVPVSVEKIHTGLPVTVYYSIDGPRRVATKVVVHPAIVVPAPTPGPVPR